MVAVVNGVQQARERFAVDQDPRIGTVLKDKWRIDALLGAGGMATVYAATHRNGKRVAVKVLRPELSREAAVRERFVREGYLANKVGRGAVTVDDDDVTEDGAAFLVMELLDGETLEARRERSPGGRLPVADVVAAMDQVLATLVVAHAQGIVHRDLKPENVFVTRDGAVKVLDFGIARLREGGGASKSTTATGAVMGTPAYLPPEQARGHSAEVDARTDLWAIGATMFALLAGRCVHEAETVNLLLLAAMTKPAPPLRSVAPDVPRELAAVVDRALALERDARWPDASAMREALLRACPEIAAQLSSPNGSAVLQVPEGSTTSARTPEARTTYRTATSAKTVHPAKASGRSRIIVAAVGAVIALGAAWGLLRARSAPAPSAATAADAEQPVRSPESIASATPSASAPIASATPSVISVSVDELPDVAPTVASSTKPRAKPQASRPKQAPDPFSVRR
jgi:eukaryotic-like serine/threonine-protein kinase